MSGTVAQQLVVAESQIANILPLLHESPCTGHLEIEKTYNRAQERFFWPGMKRDVREWVNSCDECLRRKGTPQKHRHSLTTWQASHPFWQVSLDVMGPLPDSKGCRYILLIGDHFSGWYEAVGMPNQEAQTVAGALVEKWITRFGCPVNLHSDKGTNFMSELFRELCRILGIQRTSPTSFHPEGNAMIERTNRTLEKSISKYVNELQHDWKNYLQLVMMAYRSSVHSLTKYSHAYVIFGTPLKLPIDCMYETRHTESNPTPSDFIFKTRRELQRAHHQIRIHMEVEQTKQKTYYDYRAYGPTYKEGQQVLVFFPTVKKGETKKFTSSYKGPYTNVKIINDLNFQVCHNETKKTIEVHYDRLKQYRCRERTSVKINETKRQSELEEKSFIEEVDDDFIEIEVEQTNEPKRAEQRENFQNENPETAHPHNDAITVEEDPNERSRSESSRKDGSSSQRDNFLTETIKQKNQKKKTKNIPPPREKSTRIRSVPKSFADYFVYNPDDDNFDTDDVFTSGNK